MGQAREGTPDETGVGRTKDDGAVTVQRKGPRTPCRRATPPASTMKRTLPATNKERALRTRDPRSGGAYVVDGRDNAWRSRAPAARQVVDGLRMEVWGQQKQSNDPRNNQHNPSAPTTGLRERANDTSRSTGCSGRQNAANRRSMRREERVTVQGPVKKQQLGGMSHRGIRNGRNLEWQNLHNKSVPNSAAVF